MHRHCKESRGYIAVILRLYWGYIRVILVLCIRLLLGLSWGYIGGQSLWPVLRQLANKLAQRVQVPNYWTWVLGNSNYSIGSG